MDVQTAMLTSTSHLTSSDDNKVQKLQDALPCVTFHVAAYLYALAKSQGDIDQAAGLLILIQHGESSEESTMVLAANGDSPSGSSSSQPGRQPKPKTTTADRQTEDERRAERLARRKVILLQLNSRCLSAPTPTVADGQVGVFSHCFCVSDLRRSVVSTSG